MKCRQLNLIVFTVILLASCSEQKKNNAQPLFQLMDSTGINFRNEVVDGKLENSFLFRNFYNGGGVAIGDINNDGLPDVFFTSNSGANKLYLNKGNFKFEDISDKAGIIHDDKWNTGVVFADINGDGWLDIYVCSSGHMGTGSRKNKLYINNHNNTFTESAKQYGLDISAYTTQVSFFDYDGDGDLDCFMINNSPIPINQLNYANQRDVPDSAWKVASFLKGGGDHLFRNDNGHFTEVTHQAGIHGGLISFGLGVSVGDINGDGWPDIFVSNDSYERDYLYINQKNGTFKDQLEDWFQHTSFSSMGADIADINNDGYPDIFTTDMLPMNDYRLKTTGSFDHIDLFNSKLRSGFYYQYTKNCLQLNNQNGKFVDIARYSGVTATDWSWGALMFDMDNDGWNDLYVCNGVNHDVTNLDFMDFFADEVIQKMVMTGKKDEVDKVLKEIPQTPIPNKVFRNNHNLKFTDIGDQWGLSETSFSNGAAYADLDNDGDLDLIVSNENAPAFVYKNNSREFNHNHFLSVSLKGTGKNPFAIGTKLQLYAGNQIMTREEFPSRGFQSSVDYKLHFGLGNITAIDSMVITWPDRTSSILNNIKPDQLLVLDESTTPKQHVNTSKTVDQNTFFKEVKTDFDKHVENDYFDFYQEKNIPCMLSREGPKAATADVNGDGLTDIFIGGTPGHPGQLYLQKADGSFKKSDQLAFKSFMDFEDVAVLFFDYDRDGDMDLLICPGGNNVMAGNRQLQLRLFKNDGKGNFTLDADAFPNVGMDVSVAISEDFNHDGYPDLFIGSRNYPMIYGKDPQSFLFVNDGKGHFTDIAATKNKDISSIGMVTGAVFADITGDQQKELIIVGEWMYPKVFSFKADHFEEVKTNLNQLSGWWQTVSVADLNNDGKQDLILGNIGENFSFHPDQDHPVKLWLNDFDQNGNLDKILTQTIDGKDMPVFLKRDLESQLPIIKKNNLKHKDYATKSIQELFPADAIDRSDIKVFNYASSCICMNNGNGSFEVKKLPVQSQLSCVNAIQLMDLNQDGFNDIITGGNQFGFLPQFERLDGSFGDILINDGKGNFISVPQQKTGFKWRGMVRDIKRINVNGGEAILVLQNDEYPQLYFRTVNNTTKNKK
jgi:ASPIC and UnbV./FG-GAP repeat.